MSIEIRKQQAVAVATMIAELVELIQRMGLTWNGEYVSILKGIAFVIDKERYGNCFALDDLIREHLNKQYGLQHGSRSDEVKKSLKSLLYALDQN